MFGLSSLFSFLASPSAEAPPKEVSLKEVSLKDIPVALRTPQQNRQLLADYIDERLAKGDELFMLNYDCCAWGMARQSGLFGTLPRSPVDGGREAFEAVANRLFGEDFPYVGGLKADAAMFFRSGGLAVCARDVSTYLRSF